MRNCMFFSIVAMLCAIPIMSAQTENPVAVFQYKKALSFERLSNSGEGAPIVQQYPFLKNYEKQSAKSHSAQKRVLSRMPNIGLNYEFNKELKTSYVPNQQNGWYFPDKKYYLGIYGKRYRKDKTKKGSHYLEQRLYKIVKMKDVAHLDVDFESPNYLEDVYNVREIIDGKATIVGYAVLFSDNKNDLKKRLLFFDNEMNLKLDKDFESRQKKMFIYDILKKGDSYCILNSSSAGLLKKGDGQPRYEFNLFNKESTSSELLDIPTVYGTVIRLDIDHIIQLKDQSTFLVGNVIYVDANQNENPEKDGNFFYAHFDKNGKLIDNKTLQVKLHVEPKNYYFNNDESHFVLGVEKVNEASEDLVLIVNKETGKIKTHFSSTPPADRYIYKDDEKAVVYYCHRNVVDKIISITELSLN